MQGAGPRARRNDRVLLLRTRRRALAGVYGQLSRYYCGCYAMLTDGGESETGNSGKDCCISLDTRPRTARVRPTIVQWQSQRNGQSSEY